MTNPRWNPEFTSPFIRDLNSIPEKIAAAIVEFATGTLPENPHKMSKPLGAGLEGMRSVRHGDYRVIIKLDEETRTIYLRRAGHRANIYRP